jgi:hypothetical protein
VGSDGGPEDRAIRIVRGGVEWRGGPRELFDANLSLRAASRVLVRVASFEARSFRQLERHAGDVDWARWIAPGTHVDLNVTCRKSRLYHQRAVAERVLAAIERAGGVAKATPGPAEDEGDADAQLFVVRFDRDRCWLYRDAIVLGCLDSRIARLELSERASRVARVLIDIGIDGPTRQARVQCFEPGSDGACVLCGWLDSDFTQLEQVLPCDAAHSAAPE